MAATEQSPEEEPDPFEVIRQEADAFEEVGEREDRIGAIARYFLAVARGEVPEDRDAELAGLPKLGGDRE